VPRDPHSLILDIPEKAGHGDFRVPGRFAGLGYLLADEKVDD
jgi:hypothetical protein